MSTQRSHAVPRWRIVSAALLTLVALIAARSVGAQAAELELTQIGSPIWRPTDFHLFSAPASPFPAAFDAVVDTLAPLDGFTGAYTPHVPPYGAEIAAGMAAGGYVDRADFLADDIVRQPTAVYFAYVLVPDPGVVGSSRDFGSGPIIPNAITPIARDVDVWLDGALVDRLLGSDVNTSGDFAFDGFSHRPVIQAVWHPWDDDLEAGPTGSYELRMSMRDVDDNGWDLVVPFVVPEPSSSQAALAGVLGVLGFAAGRRAPG